MELASLKTKYNMLLLTESPSYNNYREKRE
jgi:hypothetical protein